MKTPVQSDCCARGELRLTNPPVGTPSRKLASPCPIGAIGELSSGPRVQLLPKSIRGETLPKLNPFSRISRYSTPVFRLCAPMFFVTTPLKLCAYIVRKLPPSVPNAV